MTLLGAMVPAAIGLQVRLKVVCAVMAGEVMGAEEQVPFVTGTVFEYPGAVMVQLFTSVAFTVNDTVLPEATRSGLAESAQVGLWTVTVGNRKNVLSQYMPNGYEPAVVSGFVVSLEFILLPVAKPLLLEVCLHEEAFLHFHVRVTVSPTFTSWLLTESCEHEGGCVVHEGGLVAPLLQVSPPVGFPGVPPGTPVQPPLLHATHEPLWYARLFGHCVQEGGFAAPFAQVGFVMVTDAAPLLLPVLFVQVNVHVALPAGHVSAPES